MQDDKDYAEPEPERNLIADIGGCAMVLLISALAVWGAVKTLLEWLFSG